MRYSLKFSPHLGRFVITDSVRKTMIFLLTLILFPGGLYAQKTDKFMGEIVNYDESTVPAYTLPEILLTTKGERVKNTSIWEKKRRPELFDLFEVHVYG